MSVSLFVERIFVPDDNTCKCQRIFSKLNTCVCALILWKSGLVLLMGKFRQFLTVIGMQHDSARDKSVILFPNDNE